MVDPDALCRVPAGSSGCLACYLLPQVSQRRMRGRCGVSGCCWRGESLLLFVFLKARRCVSSSVSSPPASKKWVSSLVALPSASAGPAPGGERLAPLSHRSAPSRVPAAPGSARIAAASLGRRGSPLLSHGCERWHCPSIGFIVRTCKVEVGRFVSVSCLL